MRKLHDVGEKIRALYSPEGGVRSVFSSKVADYTASRPDYPEALFATLKTRCAPPGALVADVGAGTGLLTEGLLRNKYRVVAVEPNAEMRAASSLRLGGMEGYRSIDGCAESIPLPTGSVDLITAAQAFHWFEADKARAECLRVLKPGGQVALIWNDRLTEDPIQTALNGIFSEFGGIKRAALALQEDRSDVPRFFGAATPEDFSWPHDQLLDEKGLQSLVFSRSYIPGRETVEGVEILRRVKQIVGLFLINNKVKIQYRTIAIVGRPSEHES